MRKKGDNRGDYCTKIVHFLLLGTEISLISFRLIKYHGFLEVAIYDKYGEDTKITKLGEDKYYAKLPVEDSPTFWGWIFMLEDRIRILSPSHLVKEYSEKLDRMKRIVKCV